VRAHMRARVLLTGTTSVDASPAVLLWPAISGSGRHKSSDRPSRHRRVISDKDGAFTVRYDYRGLIAMEKRAGITTRVVSTGRHA
jgi:hypothetical protein